MSNPFANAVSLNQTDYFLLGKEPYFFLDRDRGVHDPTTTGMILAEYGTLFGCDAMQGQLNGAFERVLRRDDLTEDDIRNLLALIFFWKSYREHKGASMCQWELPSNISTNLINLHERLRNSSDSQVADSLVERLRGRFNWP